MKIGILGTGMVGRAHAARLVQLGHNVMVGTRDVAKTMVRTDNDANGLPAFSVWQKANPKVKLGTFSEAADHGEVVIHATKGETALNVLKMAGDKNLSGKILIDISNPLIFSKTGVSLSVCNKDSLGERIQRAFPRVKVVKTLNTVNAGLQTNPRKLAGGDHNVFVSGNDAEAKSAVIKYLKDWYGWKNVIDLGDITTARGAEMLLPLWAELMSSLKTPLFSFKVVK